MLEALTQWLADSKNLRDEQVGQAVEQLIAETVSAPVKAEFLSQLGRKGETVEEIAAFAIALRSKSIGLPLDSELRSSEILDVVGTGGDQLGTFNISTTVAIVCAAAGVRVAKHGNRAATSRCGSADVLEALGVPIHLAP
jgi:anthranilate phosphoribosyltransferase